MSDDETLEWKLRAGAIPAAFAIALAFYAWPTGHWLQRTFLTMIPHELGHAITSWFCGLPAIPTVWKTLLWETRSGLVIALVACANAALVIQGWRTQRIAFWATGLALGLLQFVGTTLSTDAAQMAITFGGDAGAMAIGAALVCLFFVPPGSRLQTTHLRWGFLAIGAATLVDTAATWFAARGDHDRIPFGEIEGVGLSDPSKLDELYGWTARQIAERYANFATACIAIVVIAWLYATWRARRDL